MTTATSSPVVRFGRRVAELLADMNYAQRRMVEISVGVQPPARRDSEAHRSSATWTVARGGGIDGATAGLMC
jgi:hypothetical protein